VELAAEVVPLAKRSEAPTPADTPRRFFLTGVIKPVSESLGMYLQADKPLFPILCLHHPSRGALRPSRGARGGAGRPHKKMRRKKRSLKPPVHLAPTKPLP